jgi:chemotaxis signal transduction protein
MAIAETEQVSATKLWATFFLRDALCAIDAAGVQEVIRLGSVTPVRHAPDEVTGDSRIFIVEDRNEFLGLLVDHVGEVLEIEPGRQEPIPGNIPSLQAHYFSGVYRANGRVIALLNPATLLAESKA